MAIKIENTENRRNYITHPLTYAGIGSRETPGHILNMMVSAGYDLCNKGWVLRSGGAGGADMAFEEGSDSSPRTKKEIYIPWNGFQGRYDNQDSVFCDTPPEAYQIASTLHPAWHRCSPGAQKLHARNVQQILGRNIDHPVDMVLCYTRYGLTKGGTATAINLAKRLKIPVFNFGVDSSFDEASEFVQQITDKMLESQAELRAASRRSGV